LLNYYYNVNDNLQINDEDDLQISAHNRTLLHSPNALTLFLFFPIKTCLENHVVDALRKRGLLIIKNYFFLLHHLYLTTHHLFINSPFQKKKSIEEFFHMSEHLYLTIREI